MVSEVEQPERPRPNSRSSDLAGDKVSVRSPDEMLIRLPQPTVGCSNSVSSIGHARSPFPNQITPIRGFGT